MNWIYFWRSEWDTSKNQVVATSERARYIFERHDLTVNSQYPIVIEGQGQAAVQVQVISQDRVVGKVVTDFAPPLPLSSVSLLVAVCRPQSLKRVIYAATAAGITQLVFVPSERGEKSYLTSRELTKERISDQVVQALEQTGGALAPDVQVVEPLRDALASISANDSGPSKLLVAHPGSAVSLATALHSGTPATSHITLAFGGEKGWSERELAVFRELDYQPVNLGDRVQRVDMAVAFALGAVL